MRLRSTGTYDPSAPLPLPQRRVKQVPVPPSDSTLLSAPPTPAMSNNGTPFRDIPPHQNAGNNVVEEIPPPPVGAPPSTRSLAYHPT